MPGCLSEWPLITGPQKSVVRFCSLHFGVLRLPHKHIILGNTIRQEQILPPLYKRVTLPVHPRHRYHTTLFLLPIHLGAGARRRPSAGCPCTREAACIGASPTSPCPSAAPASGGSNGTANAGVGHSPREAGRPFLPEPMPDVGRTILISILVCNVFLMVHETSADGEYDGFLRSQASTGHVESPSIPRTDPAPQETVHPPFPHGGSGVIVSAALFRWRGTEGTERGVHPEEVLGCIDRWIRPKGVGR